MGISSHAPSFSPPLSIDWPAAASCTGDGELYDDLVVDVNSDSDTDSDNVTVPDGMFDSDSEEEFNGF